MRRRSLLIGISALFAGCAGSTSGQTNSPQNRGDVGRSPVVDLEIRSLTDTEIARQVTYRIDAEDRTSERELAATVIADGSATVTATNRPVPENRPFVYDRSVYELSYEVVGQVPATTFRFTPSAADGTVSDDQTIQYSALPEVDKAFFEKHGWEDGGPFEAQGVEVLYRDSEITDSVLVPEPEYPVIVWDSGSRARLTVENPNDTELKTYEYNVQQIHESAEQFGRETRENNALTLDDLSSDQEEIITQAIENEHGYEIRDRNPPEAVERLLDRFSRHDEVSRVNESTAGENSPTSGWYLVRFDDDVYWTELSAPDGHNRSATS